MDALQRARRPVRNGAKKRIAELNRLFQVEPISKERIQFVLKTLNEEQINLAELDQKILGQMVDDGVDETDQDTEYEAIIEMRQQIMTTCFKAEEIIESLVPVVLPPSSITFGSEGGARGFRLPKIELKKFSGEFKDWLGYWAQFEKIDQDSSLPVSDKFQYLLQSLLPGTDAHEIASSYPQSNENYPKVIEALKRRYGNEDLLLQVYIRELLKLVISNVNSNDKIPFQMLHIKLESHLRALKTLNLEKADPATWLYPLVESSLPEEILLTWQRSSLAVHDGSEDTPSRNRLDLLMEFLDKEVGIQQKISLARKGFGMEIKPKKANVQAKNKLSQPTPTLASCHDGDQSCLFCGKSHGSKECSNAKKWPLEKKRDVLKEKQVCSSCFKSGHPAKFCKNKKNLNCFICGGKHYPVMCSNLADKSKGNKVTDYTTSATAENMTGCVNQICSKEIDLQTLIVRARCGTKEKTVRIFLDNGSQGSYILKSTAKDLELEVKGTNKITHSLFGGTQTKVITHNIHHVTLDKIGGKEYSCIIGVRDEEKICNFIPRVSSNSIVVKELNRKKIKLSDVGDGCPPIEILLGVDVYGRLLTGNKITLSNEVTAIETKLGWTLCGRMGERDDNNLSMCILSMVIQDASVSQLWDLDLLGIRDETDVISVEQQEQEDKQKFFNCLTRNADGRYVVSLPWIDDHPPLPTNYEVARLRLNHATKRLEENKLFEEYAKLFQLWKDEDFIEEINPIVCDKKEKVHYVSHRAVIKLSSSTTPVRPVFDASCKVGKGPSLNECLKKGNNFIKMIPDMLLLFREKKVGFVSDIRKAIQMIEVNEQDRDCMRFLWWKDKSKQHVVEYRHKRVMFGTNCSPFILGAVLEFHLVNVQNENKDIAQKLYNSLYVDNCVSSENTVEEYKNFRTKSVQLLAEAGMDFGCQM
ncbi:uncharacterized protein LOC116180664 [Photinus pyralis]|uniref:uncharacterized protein LOC116180664 n=1 Tax=Photinus pyralis TaxID=7054 RepID=UPI001267573E|nr:uncharacterized protein LOC116180664 [Photinus pyralis]